GSGRKSLAADICAEVGIPVLTVDVRDVLSRGATFESTLRSIFREGILRPAAIYLDRFEALLEDESKSATHLRAIARCVDEFSWMTFIATEKPWEPAGLFNRHRVFVAELPMPDEMERREIWQSLAMRAKESFEGVDWTELAAKFKLTPQQMRNGFTAAI